MKIPNTPGRTGPATPDGAGNPTETAGNRTSANRGTQAYQPREPAGGPASLQRLSPGPEWRRTDLDDPAKKQQLIRESVAKVLAGSPMVSSLNTQQLHDLQRHLAGDPVVGELLTTHLEQSLA